MAILMVVGIACDRPIESPATTEPSALPDRKPAQVVPRAGISELEPGATLPTAAGQTVYLPIFGAVADGSKASADLAVTVTVRNTDETKPIIVVVIRHRDADGRTLREYLRPPARLAPRASLDVAIKRADNGVNSESVLVEWVADRPVSEPIVEALMVSRAREIAIHELGRVIEDRAKPPASTPR